MTTSEKVAYLKGLMEGMELDQDSKEGKLFKLIADILEDLALDVEDLEENSYDLADEIDGLGEEIDAISEDLEDLEDLVYDDEDEDEDDNSYGCGRCCGRGYDDEEDEEDPVFFEVTCPACEKTITVDEDVINLGSIQCPNCGEMLEFELDEDEEEEDGEGEEE